MYYKLKKEILNETYSFIIKNTDKNNQKKQEVRDYYSKNESNMSEERKRVFKSLFKEIWGEEL